MVITSKKDIMELFSRRRNIRQVMVGPEEMPEELRNRLWNVVSKTIEGDRHNRNALIEKIWSDFYKKETADLEGTTSYL